MTHDPNQFMEAAFIGLNDIEIQTAFTRATRNANIGRENMIGELDGPQALRQQARGSRLRGLHDLPDLLEQAEAQVIAAGGEVIWAEDGAEANQHVLRICREHNVKRGVKVKSMVTEEIGLVPFLHEHGIQMQETDLGEYIVQVTDDRPSHITMPVMHRTKESIRKVLMEKVNMPYVETPEEMTAFAREQLRQSFLDADFGISGGNFLIAETGHLINVTNEGNGRLTTGLPPLHIAVVGIEKVIPTWEDFLTLLQLLTRSATGQRLTVYMNAMRGPARDDDNDGARKFYLILLDNGRSDIYASEYAEALACIRCGACLNTCPVYQNVGGHAYGSVYPGPIGAVITPLLMGKENAVPLPFASSLCGACKTACPVDINIPDMLLMLRHDLEDEQDFIWKAAMRGFRYSFGHPLLFEAGEKIAGVMGSEEVVEKMGRINAQGEAVIDNLPYPLSGWTDKRDLPPIAAQSFRDWWRANRK